MDESIQKVVNIIYLCVFGGCIHMHIHQHIANLSSTDFADRRLIQKL